MDNKLPYSEKYNCIDCEHQYTIKIGGHGGTEHFCNNYDGNIKVDYYDGRFIVCKEINDCKNFKLIEKNKNIINIETTGKIEEDVCEICNIKKPITIVLNNNLEIKICNKCLHLKLQNKEWYIKGAKW